MISIHAQSALTPDGWRRDVRLTVEDGLIASLEHAVPPDPQDERCAVLVPGMPNVHSHAFQRGMAGLAEVRGPVHDNFWSWRTQMYRFALSMTPDHVEAVASQLYMEMLEAGFCRVGEFHYLHHDHDGRPYANVAEMAERIAAAADHTGIGLTLLPVFYAHSTFGGAAPSDGQRRFICDVDRFEKLLAGCKAAVAPLPGATLGIAPHSLRAVTPQELAALTAMSIRGPIHIHAAEQTKEVQDCLAWSGARPVQWLLDNAAIDARWTLIHTTHMTEDEIRRLAQSGATSGLCPITEANLGDGIFSASPFLDAGGNFGIGSDSNIQIGVADELRQLEYSQRLQHRLRNVIAPVHTSTGRTLFDHALRGGGRALQTSTGLAIGNPADFVSLTTRQTPHVTEDAILDLWIFARGIQPDGVWVRGRKLVHGGIHISREQITARFAGAMLELHLKQ
ncbi:MAG TPA: formimidoylglutamate deiminase [Phycisphaerae bacterium]|nr:formimidoylglutamate deiminase [Phycisphaerae bacterium]